MLNDYRLIISLNFTVCSAHFNFSPPFNSNNNAVEIRLYFFNEAEVLQYAAVGRKKKFFHPVFLPMHSVILE